MTFGHVVDVSGMILLNPKLIIFVCLPSTAEFHNLARKARFFVIYCCNAAYFEALPPK